MEQISRAASKRTQRILGSTTKVRTGFGVEALGTAVLSGKGPKAIVDLRDAAAYHALVLSAENASTETQRNYLFHWKILIDYCDASGTGIALSEFTRETIRAASEWYRRRANPNSSRQGAVGVRQFVQRMNTAGNFLIREEVIPESQFRSVRAPRVAKVLRKPFDEVEVNAMWGAAQRTRNPERDSALFLLLLNTGMRIGEAASLSLEKIDLSRNQITIGAEGKSRRERLVPIGSVAQRDGGRAVRALKTYLKVRPGTAFDQGRLFLSAEGHPLPAVSLSNIIQRLGDLAGIDNPIPHRLRHTFATDYLTQYPGDETGLRRIIGHVSNAVLEDYVHLAQSTIADRAGHVALSERWLGTSPQLQAARLLAQREPERRRKTS